MQTRVKNKKIVCLLTPIALAVSHVFVVTAHAEEPKLAPVEVVATTPLAGIGVPKEQIAANVQTATGQQIEDSGALNIADYMNKNMTGVHVNDNQGNPFQVDLNYRGFTASPLLGTPQGISVYMDGVRMNQPFGDIVQWDLIPKSAIKNMTLIPGSNPLFGLNTLGGAISIQTKDGLSYQGTEVEAGIGSYGRYSTEFETGGKNNHGLNWYVNATRWGEDGWRDSSPSGITQLFSKLGWKSRDTDLKLTYALANSNLTGNGLQQKELLDSNYKSVFTKPDQTHNNSNFLNLEGKHSINENTIFTGNAYYRKTKTHTFNGDLNDESLEQAVWLTNYGTNSSKSMYNDRAWLGINRSGYSVDIADTSNGKTNVNGTFPSLRCIAQAGQSTEPNEKCNGIVTSTSTDQRNYGLSGQLSFLNDLTMGKNNLIVGAGADFSSIKFNQKSQFGYLNADRSLTLVNAYADGTQDSEGAFSNAVDLSGKTRTLSIFGSNIFSLNDTIHITSAARYNNTLIKNTDNLDYTAINASMDAAGSTNFRNSLSGNHSYSRINPSAGIAFTPNKTFNSYVSYSESNRAPTSIELACADPEFACRLPNSMAGDPHLKQVVAKTWEVGARGFISDYKFGWAISAFNTNLTDDILFVTKTSGGGGYFKNFGETKRQGVELGGGGFANRFSYSMNYTYLLATYESDDIVGSQYNSTKDSNDVINVRKGNYIPLMPKSIFKARLGYDWSNGLTTNLGMTAVAQSYARGNENNADPSGKVPGYAIFDLGARYKIDQQITVSGLISNLMGNKYYTAGQLGPAAYTASGSYANSATPTMMYSPGAPRTFWVSMRYTFDKPRKD